MLEAIITKIYLKQSPIVAIVVLISLTLHFFLFFVTLGPKADQAQMMMHYNKIAKFLQMLKRNLYGVKMNFAVVY